MKALSAFLLVVLAWLWLINHYAGRRTPMEELCRAGYSKAKSLSDTLVVDQRYGLKKSRRTCSEQRQAATPPGEP